MKFNKDTIIPLVLLMGVTIFFHWRQSQTDKQMDKLVAEFELVKQNVDRIAYVTKTELKNLKETTETLKNLKEKPVNLDQKDLEDLKKKVESLTLGNSAKLANVMLCDGDAGGVIKLYKSGNFVFYESASVAAAKPTGRGTYKIEGPIFAYSGVIKEANGGTKNLTGRAFITQQTNKIISGINVDSALYSTEQCNKGVIQKFK